MSAPQNGRRGLLSRFPALPLTAVVAERDFHCFVFAISSEILSGTSPRAEGASRAHQRGTAEAPKEQSSRQDVSEDEILRVFMGVRMRIKGIEFQKVEKLISGDRLAGCGQAGGPEGSSQVLLMCYMLIWTVLT